MNYAIPMSRISQDPFKSMIYGEGWNPEQRRGFDDQMPAGYSLWLKSLAPHLAYNQDAALKRIFGDMQSRFTADVLSNPAEMSGTSWMDWLGKRDVNQELAQLPSESRGQRSSQFMRPARYMGW